MIEIDRRMPRIAREALRHLLTTKLREVVSLKADIGPSPKANMPTFTSAC